MDWKTWIKGIVSAFIGASANSITVMIIDPVAFNLGVNLSKTLTVAVVSGAVAVALYLKQSPLPPEKKIP